MDSECKVGRVVWVFKTGCEGEIVNLENQELQTKYHIRVPAENEVYVFGPEDFYVFGPIAEANIRKEWGQAS